VAVVMAHSFAGQLVWALDDGHLIKCLFNRFESKTDCSDSLNADISLVVQSDKINKKKLKFKKNLNQKI
jgi:hypothetical protein